MWRVLLMRQMRRQAPGWRMPFQTEMDLRSANGLFAVTISSAILVLILLV